MSSPVAEDMEMLSLGLRKNAKEKRILTNTPKQIFMGTYYVKNV